ncbi:unnamed protein product [Alopecurus aequalis]
MTTAGGGIALDDDVLTEILLRLPPKSVLRARAVSKHWRHIATRPCFVAAYSPRRPPEIIVFYDHELTATTGNDKKQLGAVGAVNFAAGKDNLVRRPLLHFDAGTLQLEDFCDGLLLFHRGDKRLIVWNPATRQGLLLPPPPVTSPQNVVCPFGFYCHRASGEYKVLCHVEQTPHWYILSTSGAEPQRLEVEDNITAPTCNGVALHGSLHWLIHAANSGDSDKMIAFDTVSDKFRQMAPPLVPAASSSCYRVPHLFEMHGLLAASAVRDLPYMDVWVLQDYNRQRWEWRLRITIPQARRMYRPPFTASALGVLDGNVLVVLYDGVVILYDMVGKTEVSTMINIRAKDMSAVWGQAGIYRESLVSLTSTPA